ncbi:MAG: PepSY-like domain-containing protein [Candidatus Sumerlaeaceae bacterium]|nr:PepSY-like domain-containing protein [Candidatus Sumerlaeaceae bacterium]
MKPWIAVALAVTLVAAVRLVTAEDKTITEQDLPEPVRSALKKEAPGAKILEIEAETEGGSTVYSIEVEVEGKKKEFHFSPAGQAVKDDEDDDDGEKTIALSEAPAPVRETVAKLLKGAAPISVTVEEEDDGELYEVEYADGGTTRSVELTAEGAVVEDEETVATDSVPAAVAAAIAKARKGGDVREVTLVRKYYYEVEVVRDGKTHELQISPAGKAKKADDDEDEDDD